MALVEIKFIGPWKRILGAKSASVEIETIQALLQYIETHYGPIYERDLHSRGVRKKASVREHSHILLNGRNVITLDAAVLKDGDRIYIVPRIAGG